MTKHYFVSYVGLDKGTTMRGHALIAVTNQSFPDIVESIEKNRDIKNVTITCLKD